MERKYLSVLVMLLWFFVIAFFFDISSTDKSVVSASLVSSTGSASASIVNPITPPSSSDPVIPYCKSLDVTSVFAQRLGTSSKTSSVYQMERLDNRYFTVSFYSYNSSSFQLYLYDLGIDGLFNTTDDNGIFIGQPYSQYVTPTLYSTSPNSQDLFWVGRSITAGLVDINRCTLSSQGCTNAKTVTTVTIAPTGFGGIITSSLKNRIYLAYYDSNMNNLIYDSCSLQLTAVDSCTKGQSYFTNHATLPASSSIFQRTLSGVGFIHQYFATNNLFNVQLPIPSSVPLPNGIDIDSLSSRVGVKLLGINNSVNSSISLVIIDDVTGAVLAKIDTLDPMSSSHLIDLTNLGIVTVYRSNKLQSFMEKRTTIPAVPIYSDQLSAFPEIILSDATVLGYSSSNSILKSLCYP